MALDFPASPSNGQTYTGPGGVIWVWDGTKWVNGTNAGTYAPLASPAFTGNPTAPTPPLNDADTSVATTAYVIGQASTTAPTMDGTAVVGSATTFARGDHTHPSDTTRLPVAGGTITGNLTVNGTGSIAGNTINANGIVYANRSGNAFGFSWASPNITAYVDNTNTGILATQGWAGGVFLALAGGTISGPLTVNGTLTGNGTTNLSQTNISTLTVTANGVQYWKFGTQAIGFSWAGATLTTWIDGVNAGGLNPASDYRIKQNVVPLGGMWEAVKALRPVSFNMADYHPKEAPTVDDAGEPMPSMFQADGIERWGFIAHELQETLIPDAASGYKDAPGLIQSPNPWTVLASVTRALQEAMARIEALEGLVTPGAAPPPAREA